MEPYLDLIRTLLRQGRWQNNRTGIRTLRLPGAMLRFDLQDGFPAITTRRLAFRSAMAELVGFLRGHDRASDFRALGSRVWDQNANDNAQWLANPWRDGVDALGPVYGVQWRAWPGYRQIADDGQPGSKARFDAALASGWQLQGRIANAQGGEDWLLYRAIDQLRHCLDTIVDRPEDRRILFHAWNPAQLDMMALPPCHLLYQFLPDAEAGELSLCLYVRSNDMGLGAPFNLAEAAALSHLVARLTGLQPRWLTYFIGDAHLYENHLPMVEEMLQRTPLPLPRLALSPRIPELSRGGDGQRPAGYDPTWLDRVEPTDFELVGYRHHPPLTAPMAV